MAAPSDIPRWADVTAGNRIEPSSGRKDGGFLPAERPPAQWFNWLLFAICKWLDYDRAMLGGTDGDGEWAYGNGSRPRGLSLFPSPMNDPASGNFWPSIDGVYSMYPKATGSTQYHRVNLTPYLSSGMLLNTVELICEQAGASYISARVWKMNGSGASYPTITAVSTAFLSSGAAGVKAIDCTFTETIDRANNRYYLEIISGQSGDVAINVSLLWTEPGPGRSD